MGEWHGCAGGGDHDLGLFLAGVGLRQIRNFEEVSANLFLIALTIKSLITDIRQPQIMITPHERLVLLYGAHIGHSPELLILQQQLLNLRLQPIHPPPATLQQIPILFFHPLHIFLGIFQMSFQITRFLRLISKLPLQFG